jgi:phosphoribosylformylglycinamidine cyclo-ligase
MNESKKNNYSYGSSGVDVELGRKFVEMIKPLARQTKTAENTPDLGGFGAVFDIGSSGFKDPLLVAATDGVGTKLLLAKEANAHKALGIDLVAMCVNDLIAQGARPLFFLDYIAAGNLDTSVGMQIVEGIVQGCKEARCALIGGETAEMPGLYARGHYDLAGFVVGAVERSDVIDGRKIEAGDQIIGLASTGFHANGFSLIRQILTSQGIELSDILPFSQGQTVGEALLKPTRIYTESILRSLAKVKKGIKGLAHITGGGFYENIPRMLPKQTTAIIDASGWSPPPLFKWLQKIGNLGVHEMFNTFNCGIGMVLVVKSTKMEAIISTLKDSGENVFHIGEIQNLLGNNQQIVIKELQGQWD